MAQFGPRIRIGGTLGRLGQNIKRETGRGLRNPLVLGGLGALTGGTTLPLLAGLLGGVLDEKADAGDVLRGGARGALAGSTGKFLRGAGRNVVGLFKGGGASALPGAEEVGAEAIEGLPGGDIAKAKDALSSGPSALDRFRPIARDIPKYVTAASEVYKAHGQESRARRAERRMEEEWNAGRS